MTDVWIQSNQNTFYVHHIRVEVDLNMRTVMLGSIKLRNCWTQNTISSEMITIWSREALKWVPWFSFSSLDFWIIHLWNRLYSSFYILGRAKPVPPPRSHSLEQHNYADHKKQPTTATGKDTKDKANPFAPSKKYFKRGFSEKHPLLW